MGQASNTIPAPALAAVAPPVEVAVGADPMAEALPDSLPGLVPVVDAVAVAGVEEGVMLGLGPEVIISPFPPGYVAPAAAMKSGGTPV